MGLSLQVAAFREAETIPKSAPCGKTEEGASDRQFIRKSRTDGMPKGLLSKEAHTMFTA
jgi:hypothetical protein